MNPDTKRKPKYYDELRKMDFEKTIYVSFVALLYFLVCFLAHHYYRQPFWDWSINSLIPYLQTWPNWIHETFQTVYWFIDEGIFIWMMAFFAFFNRAATLFQFLSMSLLGGVNELLKVWYRDGRPFYLIPGQKILGYDCEDKDFGRPSGHVLSSATIFVLIYL
jgi:membrane-associated phospholipid phosphatase